MKRVLLALAAMAAASFASAQGVTDTQILLGQSVALSGPAEQLGKDMQFGKVLDVTQVKELRRIERYDNHLAIDIVSESYVVSPCTITIIWT